MKEFKNVWRQTSGSCLFRPLGSASMQARWRRSRKKWAETYAHKHINACEGALLGHFDVTSSPTGAYAVTSKFKIYRYFLNRFISGSTSRRRKRNIPLFLIFSALCLWNITQVSATVLFWFQFHWIRNREEWRLQNNPLLWPVHKENRNTYKNSNKRNTNSNKNSNKRILKTRRHLLFSKV
jgi:hypothetical protein